MNQLDKLLKNLQEKEEQKNLKVKIIEFFKSNPKPGDKEIHSFADKEGINPHRFEEVIYDIMGSFFGAGRSKTFSGSYDSAQLKMGIKVEMEHTTCPLIAERITKDHLAECPDYYTRLDKMEKECE
jgi:hypothetical protein